MPSVRFASGGHPGAATAATRAALPGGVVLCGLLAVGTGTASGAGA